MEQISYKLDVFEGPMDLLLHLISKHKISINDIPILVLVEQYLDYVRRMKEENMDIASEFLEMAARLVYIKTVSLLPVHEEADILEEELKGELIEYRDCQIMAGKLSEQANGFDFFERPPEKIEPDMTYTRLHEPFELFKAYLSAVGKGKRKLPPPVEAFSGIIAHKIVSVSSRITAIISSLRFGEKNSLISLFECAESRSEMVATFLAVLALAKSKTIKIEGDTDNISVELISETYSQEVLEFEDT